MQIISVHEKCLQHVTLGVMHACGLFLPVAQERDIAPW